MERTEDSQRDLAAELTIPHKAAGELERALAAAKAEYDVDYIWLRDEFGNPIGVVLDTETFKALRG